MGGGVKIKTFPVLFISVILTNKKKKKMGIFDNLVFFCIIQKQMTLDS